MEAKAITRHIRQSPRKIRILLDDLRGSNVENALNYLHFSKAKAAYQIEKTLSSAVANLLNKSENEDVSVSSVYVKECYADGAPHLKRLLVCAAHKMSKHT